MSILDALAIANDVHLNGSASGDAQYRQGYADASQKIVNQITNIVRSSALDELVKLVGVYRDGGNQGNWADICVWLDKYKAIL